MMTVPFRRTPIAAAVGAVLCTPLPSHAFPIIADGDEFELAQDAGPSNQQAPDVAISEDGRFVAVWEQGGEILAQRFTLDGTREGGEISVPRADPGNVAPRTLPVVAMDADGDFAVAWQADYPSVNAGAEVAFQRFDGAGNIVGSARRATDDLATNNDQVEPDIAIDADGDLVIAWTGYLNATDQGVGYRLFNAISGAATSTLTASTGSASSASLGRAASGEFAIAWRNSGAESRVRAFGPLGTPLGAGSIPLGAAVVTGETDVAMDDDGDFVVVWSEYDAATYDHFVQAFRIDGSTVIAQTPIADNAGGSSNSITMLDSNEVVVTWEDNDGGGNGVFIGSFDASGNQQSGPLPVNQTTTGNQDQPSVAMDPDGEVVVAFESYVGSVEDDVLARRFTPRVVTGTAGGPGSFGWLGLVGLGLAALGRRLFGRGRKHRGGLAGLLAGALALGALGGSPDVATAAELQNAGRVESARGTVTASRDDESRRSLAAGDPVYVGDRVRTGVGASATLRLADGTEVNLRANSEFRVAALEPADDGGGGIGGLFMDFLRGGLRIVTGRVADSEPERYRLRTPVATIGVRGTEFSAVLCRGGADCPGDDETDAEPVEPAARVLSLRGVVEATGANGATRVVDAGDGVYQGDTVETRRDAWAVLLFTDGSKVSLQPGTRFRLDEWEFDRGGAEQGSALLNLLRGGLRVLTGLIGDETPDEYRVRTPVATIGVRGTGFDLFCVGTCVNPDATAGAVEGDGLFINTWDGTAVAELEGAVAEFAAGEAGFMANSVLPPVRLPSLPPALRNLPAPRPDRVLRQLPEGADRLYTEVEDGAIDVQGVTGDALAVGAGSAAIVNAGGPAIPVSPVGVGDTGGVGTGAAATIGAAFSALVAREFDLATPYAGASTGRASVDSDDAFENRLQRSHPTASVISLRNADIGVRVFGGFRMLEALAFEVGYVDLGELNSEIDPGSENESDLGQTALDEHPVTATGLDFSTLVRAPVGVNTWAFARAGVFVWEADVTTTTSSGATFSKSVDGTDPVVGGGVDHRIGPGLHARAEWIHYRLEPDQVNYVGAGLVWSFP